MIIVLNGTSSSGKTTLLKAIQNKSMTLFLEYGIDKFIFMLPKRYLSTKLWNDVLGFADKAGETGHLLVKGMHKSALCLHQNGMNLLMDHVLVEDSWKEDLEKHRKPEGIIFIKVTCPIDILEKREVNRKDRTLGQARKQIDLVHRNIEYDFEVDTSITNPDTCAESIIKKFGIR